MGILLVPVGGSEQSGERRLTPGSHYALGVVGLGIAAASVFLTYSVLVAVASVVPLLSTTVIAFVGVVVWIASWLALDVVHERYVRG